MRTLYIDVYFLINFTVDILALYFSSVFSRTPTNSRRLILSALFCAFGAVCIVLMPEITLLKIVSTIVTLCFVGLFAVKKVALKRKIKFTFCFFVLEALIGGIFSLIWSVLDKYLYEMLQSGSGGAVNRKMLFFSLIILLSIGVFKMLVSFFTNLENEGVCVLEINFLGRAYSAEAFIDSGNLAIDPMDMRPVLLLKRQAAKKIFPENVVDLHDPDQLDREIRRRIRLIPVSRGGVTHVLTGIRVDSVFAVSNDKKEEISVTVAIDKEEGTYGGYLALVPSGVLNDALYK